MQQKLSIRFLQRRDGSIAVQFGLIAVVILAAAGVALDYVRTEQERASMQEAADAAALAAARHFKSPAQKRHRIALSAFAFNYKTQTDVVPELDVSFGDKSVTVASSRDVRTTLLHLVGIKDLRASVVSEAMVYGASPICLLALDHDLPNGFEVYGNATLTAKNCAGVSNSSDDEGMRTYGGGAATASEFAVVGDFRGGFTPTPQRGIDPVADPNANLRIPASSGCIDAAERLKKADFTLDPGTYCGGLQITANATATLNPGFYLMQDGPLVIQSGAKVTAEDVTIAFKGPKATLYLQGGGSLKLTAPDEGAFKGIGLFSESVSPTVEWMTISGGATLDLVGSMYLPTHEIWLKSPNTDVATLRALTTGQALIAKRFWVQGAAALEVELSDPTSANSLFLRDEVRLVR
jgi:hypothetical protein